MLLSERGWCHLTYFRKATQSPKKDLLEEERLALTGMGGRRQISLEVDSIQKKKSDEWGEDEGRIRAPVEEEMRAREGKAGL